MSDLKPCPFCGSAVDVEKKPLWDVYGHGYKDCYEFVIRCKKCGCRVDQPQNDSVYRSEEVAKTNAIEAWNRRAQNANGKTSLSEGVEADRFVY